MNQEEIYVQRCFDMAVLGVDKVSPNPMVGAILVHKNRIIGEGYHEKFGQAHAEVNALRNVEASDKKYISSSTLYVSLEPCCIHGNTPPCTDLIIKNGIPEVVISCLDQTPKVAGEGVKKLKQSGINVFEGLLKQKGERLSNIRNTFVTEERPYIILKYAQSLDGFIGKPDRQVWLTNSVSKRLVHKWRQEADAIIVGTNTALIDNPKLTTRYFSGSCPLRIVFDKNLRLPSTLNIFDDKIPTWILSEKTISNNSFSKTKIVQLPFDQYLLKNLLSILFQTKKSTILVEGGKRTLQSFLDQNLWDEARVFTSPLKLKNGIQSPDLKKTATFSRKILNDTLRIYYNL
ncbi:MAG: bifunctional diaminohydroxyphosphoribosylaminopyrimidine deaminase/5-amino-6-(5-phosphoribosylamino)uracil reductase RibD [Bacteroidetes bacterium]|nr:bifunctional diaminohydroxyphosphoribosylaminopyrimidine deaminase/5-amino-6-(5-phosphoribosylamino)uracil reductase RibD [Bacteroidota bacterium]